VGITHFDEAPARDFAIGHIRGRWTGLGEAAGSVTVGLRRLQIPAGGWSTPAHEHGAEEELFYVLSGRGVSWQKAKTTEIGPGDCILYLPGQGAHSVHAGDDLDVLAFGPRLEEEIVGFPRLGLSLIGNRFAQSERGSVNGIPLQFVREAEVGPPELPEPGERPATIVQLDEVPESPWDRGRIVSTRRDLGDAVGSVATGLGHVVVAPGKQSTPLHCHSVEEEMFVILEGEGVALLGEDEHPVRPGTVVACPPATGVGHTFRAGDAGLTYLAYGTRDPSDMCYYPHSNKISFRGLGVIGRIERLDYWDGED
jgi:uncharacterized cupin superfamily protein